MSTHTCKCCKGTGKMTCPSCGGYGTFENGNTCYYCQGDGKVTCPACGGKGQIED